MRFVQAICIFFCCGIIFYFRIIWGFYFGVILFEFIIYFGDLLVILFWVISVLMFYSVVWLYIFVLRLFLGHLGLFF